MLHFASLLIYQQMFEQIIIKNKHHQYISDLISFYRQN